MKPSPPLVEKSGKSDTAFCEVDILKYYENCRLKIEWSIDASTGKIIGSFESDPITVNEVLGLLDVSYRTDYSATVTDSDGGLKRGGRPLTRLQVSSLAAQCRRYWDRRETFPLKQPSK